MICALVIIHILAGPAPRRLNEWARMSAYSVGGSHEQLAPLRTNEVRCGCDDPLQVLRLMLRGTGMRYTLIAPRIVRIHPIDE
jgi:hypothetical protein